jgi:hypothetical protein
VDPARLARIKKSCRWLKFKKSAFKVDICEMANKWNEEWGTNASSFGSLPFSLLFLFVFLVISLLLKQFKTKEI